MYGLQGEYFIYSIAPAILQASITLFRTFATHCRGIETMCGYIRRHVGPKTLKEFLDLLGVSGYYDDRIDDEPELKHFYPAFGGDPNRTIEGLLIREGDQLKFVSATWWYDCTEGEDGSLIVGKRTTFNARNLDSPFWKAAIRHRRAIVVCTGLGEGKTVDGKDRHYLVTSDRLMFLGAVYQSFSSEKYSCAVITRDEHPRFAPYHDKAFPLFLPHNLEFLKLWLSDVQEDHPQISQMLSFPKIFDDLTIKEVKTFKAGLSIKPTRLLTAD
jgi:putative SOS response-associated peptidase YedK